MTRGVVSKVLALALPAALKQLADILQVLIDMLMVGTLGAAALASVGLSLQFLMVVNVVIALFSVGGGAVLAQLVGQRRYKLASSLLYTLMILALLLSLPVMGIGYFEADAIFLQMGATPDVIADGVGYFGLLALGMPLIFLDALFFSAFSSAGNTTFALYIKLISAVINTFFNYLLIFGHGGFEALGVEGAAIATLIGYAFNVSIYIAILLRNHLCISIWVRIEFKRLKDVFIIGLPTALERLILVSSFMIFIFIITNYGTVALAGYQVGLRIEGIAYMSGFGFAIAALSLVGQAIGRKDLDEARQMALASALIAASIMGLVGIFLFAFAPFFASWFTDDAAVIAQAALYLKFVGVAQIPLAFMFVISSVFRGAGASRLSLMVNVSSIWLLRILPGYWVMVHGYDIFWLYVAMTIETFAKGSVLFFLFYRGYWQRYIHSAK